MCIYYSIGLVPNICNIECYYNVCALSFCTLFVLCVISVCDGCTHSSQVDTDFKRGKDVLSDVLSYKMSHMI